MYIDKSEKEEAERQLPRLMFEGLFAAGTGLGVLALIFEIAADAFSVAAYQTLLAIHGAGGRHDIAFASFSALSIMLYFGVVPAYKGAAYLRPNSGGSGPLVEAAGPKWLRPLSWIGTSLFFLDAVFTIIISSISASDVLMLLLPEFSAYRVLMAELFAFFIMAVLVLMGPQRAVPIFLIGGGAFTIFTLFALGYVGINAIAYPDKQTEVNDIVCRLVQEGVVVHEGGGDGFEHQDRGNFTCAEHPELEENTVALDEPKFNAEEAEEINHVFEGIFEVSTASFFLLFFRSMSSAMLGFSGYEVIPASGKHAARPKWKVINTSLTIAAIFLIGTGLIQLMSAWQWDIPSTEGYSTLLIEYEIVFGNTGMLTIAGVLLVTILLLAQGGGYVGGSAVASNAAKLGRMPKPYLDDRIGIASIWLVSAMTIPLIPTVTLVESFYAFGFVSAFVITSTTVYFVRKEVLDDAGIAIGSPEYKSLRFAAVRGMIASYIMAVVLVWQKFDALLFIIPAAAIITAFQYYISRGRLQGEPKEEDIRKIKGHYYYSSGIQRAVDQARQRGVADVVREMYEGGELVKFNVEPERIYRLISHTHRIDPELWENGDGHHDEGHIEEPTEALEMVYRAAHAQKLSILATIEAHSHYGIYTFVNKYAHNWEAVHRPLEEVEEEMLNILFPMTDNKLIIQEYKDYHWTKQPEEVWQFVRERYRWAKSQWTNLSDRITTIWTLQDVGVIDRNADAGDLIAKIARPSVSSGGLTQDTEHPPDHVHDHDEEEH